MAGLRERKRERLRADVVRVAAELAAARPFGAIRVRDLARRLEISEATFFNHFPTKAHVLDAWLEDELANAFAGVVASTAPGRAPLRAAVRGLAERARRASGLGAEAWRGARAQRAAGAAAERSALASALARAAERGELRRDIDARELALVLAAAVACAIAHALAASDDAALAAEPVGAATDVPARALAAADLVLDGASRRHERVRIGALASPAAHARD